MDFPSSLESKAKMECDFLTLERNDTLTPCAVRLKAPENVDRIPMHLILLLDVSESMESDNKLENVKKCCELILTFLNERDSVSLITFGEKATLHLKRVSAMDGNKESMKSIIKGLYCDGCTNLSAGLGHVVEICREDSQTKTGLLLLTDGHANRGLHRPEDLKTMVKKMHDECSNLSIHCVAYGTEHNAELLKSIAEDNQGSYNVVNTIEDTALAFGDTLGGLMSCAHQNVVVEVPSESIVHGPFKHAITDNYKKIQIGDVYAGTKPMILVDIPTSQLNRPDCVRVKGMALPSFESWSIVPVLCFIEERQLDIELTRLRYKCTEILNNIRNSLESRETIKKQIDDFEEALNDSFFDNNPIASLLRSEVATLRSTFERRLDNQDNVVLAQHIATLGLGRGFSTPIVPQRRRRLNTPVAPGFSDPTGIDEDVQNPTLTPTVSVFQNGLQNNISELMRTASQTRS